jgi:hypothetical protein
MAAMLVVSGQGLMEVRMPSQKAEASGMRMDSVMSLRLD